jgi:hypothetical protein
MDTLLADGMTPATKYYFTAVGADSTGAYDTSAVDSFTTATVGDAFIHGFALGAGYSTQNIGFDFATMDSGFHPKKTILYYDVTDGTTRKDSIQTTSHTDPDTFAITGLEEGATYYWTISVEDSGGTTWYPSDRVAPTFATTDFTQNLTITAGYSTVQIIHDSVGYYVAPLDSLILRYGTVSGTYTDSSVITSVTHPDTVALTGLMEGGTYYCIMVAFLADSSVVDSTAEFSWTNTNLQYSVSVIRSSVDSLILKVDTTNADLALDSLILQWGASLLTLTEDSASADTITTVTEPDTFIVTGLIEGGTYHYQLIAFLADSSAIETGRIIRFSRTLILNGLLTVVVQGICTGILTGRVTLILRAPCRLSQSFCESM